ncbi:trypsin-like peptidase domain-containing protein [Rhodocaloribacter sp.]
MNRVAQLSAYGLFILLWLPGLAAAQTAPAPRHIMPYALSSGVHQGQGSAPVVAFEEVVRAAGAPWVRLSFGEARLGRGSFVTVTSLKDGATQRLDARAMAQWSNTSAYFNGDAVELRLHVAPGDRDVSVAVDAVVVGEDGAGPLSQCGPTDDRVPSTDPAAGRLLNIGCTGWIIENGKIVTAGHCLATSSLANVLEFNVPPSLSSGALQHPGPEDQYTVDTSSRVFSNGGIGNDWGVFTVFDNTVTGLQPIDAQGAAFTLKQDLGPANIRITGYGVDDGVDNQTEQTHVGPNAGSSGTTMRYQTDTEGGNSGSPVIDDATGMAVGVHTHGGCSTSGGGNNSGTSTFNAAFWDALGVGGGTQDVSITLTPIGAPIVIDAAGGSFQYDIEVTNNGASSADVDIWIEVSGPGGSRTIGPISRTIAAGGTIARTLTQTVPGGLPAGTYTQTGSVGSYPTADASDGFTWEKAAAKAAGAVVVSDWATDFEALGAEAGAPEADLPAAFTLDQNYPNPFNPTTMIAFTLPEAGEVTLRVFNALGREVATLAEGFREAGSHQVRFDATDLSAGIYVYVLQSEGFRQTRRMVLLK